MPGMRQLNGVYTQLANRTHGRVGHVFQGRYKAILVDEDNYLLELARYVVLNPVRAGVVQEAKDWPWTNLSGRRKVHQQNELAGGTKTDWPRNQRERLAPGDSEHPAQAAADGAEGF